MLRTLLALLLLVHLSFALSAQVGLSKNYKHRYEKDILNALSKELNLQATIVGLPLARKLHKLKTGEIDMSIGLLKNDARSVYVDYLEPAYKQHVQKVFFVLKNRQKSIQNYEDLKNLRIGLIRNAQNFQRFDADNNLHKTQGKSIKNLFHMLVLNRLDAVIFSKNAGKYYLKTLGLNKKIAIADYQVKVKNPVYVGVSKKSSLLLEKEKLEHALKKLVESGKINTIIQTYYHNQ